MPVKNISLGFFSALLVYTFGSFYLETSIRELHTVFKIYSMASYAWDYY